MSTKESRFPSVLVGGAGWGLPNDKKIALDPNVGILADITGQALVEADTLSFKARSGGWVSLGVDGGSTVSVDSSNTINLRSRGNVSIQAGVVTGVGSIEIGTSGANASMTGAIVGLSAYEALTIQSYNSTVEIFGETSTTVKVDDYANSSLVLALDVALSTHRSLSFNVAGALALTVDAEDLIMAGALTVPVYTPGTTDNKLYNIGGDLYFNGAAVGGDAVTLAASATTGGLDLTVQEIGFQAAGAGTPVAASSTGLGDPTVTSQTHESVIDVDGVWYAAGTLSGGDAGTIFRHDGGTSWTSLLNPLNTSNYGYSWLVYTGGEIWCGGFDFPSDLVHSYNPTNDTWTGRGSNASMRPLMSGCVFDGDVVVGDNDGYVFRNTTGTTWVSLGQPGGTTLDAKSLLSLDGTDLYVTQGTKVYKYVTGTTWTDLSCPITTIEVLKNWNGTLILSGEDGSGWPVVYKYDGASWTQLGGPLVAGTASTKCLAVNSSNEIYAIYLTTGTQHVMSYDAIGDSWSEALSTGVGADAYDGSFNSSNELAIPGFNNIQQFKDAYTPEINGYLTGADWATFNAKAKWADATVENISVASGGGTAIGSIDISCNQGLVSELLAYVQTGSTDDVDVELGDASFSGSPNVLYQIGQDESLVGLWDPDTNGNWKDRNAWGFKGLTGGLLYYRFTNNGANAITMGILVDVVGKV